MPGVALHHHHHPYFLFFFAIIMKKKKIYKKLLFGLIFRSQFLSALLQLIIRFLFDWEFFMCLSVHAFLFPVWTADVSYTLDVATTQGHPTPGMVNQAKVKINFATAFNPRNSSHLPVREKEM